MNSRIVWIVSIISTCVVLASCASGYKEFYKPSADPERISTLRVSPPPAQPIVERGGRANPDDVRSAYGKRGYVVIGSSMFNSGRPESEYAAVQQAQDVGADLVLILNPAYTGSVTSTVAVTTPTTTTSYTNATATAYGTGRPVTVYGSGTTTTYGTTTNYIPVTVHRNDFGAVYFVKQRFSLGAFFRNLNDVERQKMQTNRGVLVWVIVDNSPAFEADLLVDDVIVSIDDRPISTTEMLNGLLAERRGKTISLSVVRSGQSLQKIIQLNP